MNGEPRQREAQQHAAAVAQEHRRLLAERAAQVEPQKARNAPQQRRRQRQHAGRVGRRLDVQGHGIARGDDQRHREPEQADEAQTAAQAVGAIGEVDGIDHGHRPDDADGHHQPHRRDGPQTKEIAQGGQHLSTNGHTGHGRPQLHQRPVAGPDRAAVVDHGHDEQQQPADPVPQRRPLFGRPPDLQHDGRREDRPAPDQRNLALVDLAEVGLVHPAGAPGNRFEGQRQEQRQQRPHHKDHPGEGGDKGGQIEVRH